MATIVWKDGTILWKDGTIAWAEDPCDCCEEPPTGPACCGEDPTYGEYDVYFNGVVNGSCGAYCADVFGTPFRVVRVEGDDCRFESASRSIAGCPDLGAMSVVLILADAGVSEVELTGTGIFAGQSRWKPDPDDPCNLSDWLYTYAGGGLGFADNTTRCDFTGVTVDVVGVPGT